MHVRFIRAIKHFLLTSYTNGVLEKRARWQVKTVQQQQQEGWIRTFPESVHSDALTVHAASPTSFSPISPSNWVLGWNTTPVDCCQTHHDACTPCLKKTSHLWLAITLTHMNGFWHVFGRNVTDKVGNQKTLYYATSNNLCFCTTWQNVETWKSHFTQLDCVTHTMHLCGIFLKEKITICDVFDSV